MSSAIPVTYVKVQALHWILPVGFIMWKVPDIWKGVWLGRNLRGIFTNIPLPSWDFCDGLHSVLFLGYMSEKVCFLHKGLDKNRGLLGTFVMVPWPSWDLYKGLHSTLHHFSYREDLRTLEKSVKRKKSTQILHKGHLSFPGPLQRSPFSTGSFNLGYMTSIWPTLWPT